MATEVNNKSWTTTTTSNGKWRYRELGESDGTHSTNKLVTPPIDSTSKLSGNKVLVFINVTAASTGTPTTTLFMEVSADGTNFSDHSVTATQYIPISTDFTPEATGYKVYMVDLTSFTVPYFRIGINSSGASLSSAFKCKLGFAYPVT